MLAVKGLTNLFLCKRNHLLAQFFLEFQHGFP